MFLTKKKGKNLRFWLYFRKVNVVGPVALGVNYKKKIWKRFLSSSSFWKKRAFFTSISTNSISPENNRLKKSLAAYTFLSTKGFS